jgi:sortase A
MVMGILICSYVAISYTYMFWYQHQLELEWETRSTRPIPEDQNSTLIKLSIPKIQLNAIVVAGTTRDALLSGPGHLEGSATLGKGNMVIAAHRDTFFHRLNELSKGDAIYLDDGKHSRHYVVTERKIVAPTDLTAIRPFNSERVTLITCYPMHYIGPAPKRLVVAAVPFTSNNTLANRLNEVSAQSANALASAH